MKDRLPWLDFKGDKRGNLANRDVRRWWNSPRSVLQAPQRSIEARRVALSLLALCATVWLGGCASAAPTLTRHLVRQGTPSVDLGGPSHVQSSRTAADSAAIPVQAIREVSRFTPSAANLEGGDSRLQAALALVRQSPALATHLAVAEEYRRLGIFDRAYDHLQEGARFDEHNAAINDAMARTWRDWGVPAMALSSAHRAVYAAPRSAIARHTLGTVLFALGRRGDAERAFRDVVSLDPSAWYGWQNLCHLAMADARTPDAIALCHRAASARRANESGR